MARPPCRRDWDAGDRRPPAGADPPGRRGPPPGTWFMLPALCRQQPWERNSSRNSETPFPGLPCGTLMSNTASVGVRV